jgi:hypothetical protein
MIALGSERLHLQTADGSNAKSLKSQLVTFLCLRTPKVVSFNESLENILS